MCSGFPQSARSSRVRITSQLVRCAADRGEENPAIAAGQHVRRLAENFSGDGLLHVRSSQIRMPFGASSSTVAGTLLEAQEVYPPPSPVSRNQSSYDRSCWEASTAPREADGSIPRT